MLFSHTYASRPVNFGGIFDQADSGRPVRFSSGAFPLKPWSGQRPCSRFSFRHLSLIAEPPRSSFLFSSVRYSHQVLASVPYRYLLRCPLGGYLPLAYPLEERLPRTGVSARRYRPWPQAWSFRCKPVAMQRGFP